MVAPLSPLSDSGRDAADAVVRSVERYVRSRCRSIARSTGLDADDLFQETMWKLAKAVGSGWYTADRIKPTTLADMCVKAVVHVAARKFRSRERANYVVTAGETPEGLPLCELLADALGVDPSDDAAARELVERLPAAMARLPAAEREAVVMYYGVGDSPPVLDRVIARRAGVSRQAAQKRRQQGLARLYTLLRKPPTGDADAPA